MLSLAPFRILYSAYGCQHCVTSQLSIYHPVSPTAVSSPGRASSTKCSCWMSVRGAQSCSWCLESVYFQWPNFPKSHHPKGAAPQCQLPLQQEPSVFSFTLNPLQVPSLPRSLHWNWGQPWKWFPHSHSLGCRKLPSLCSLIGSFFCPSKLLCAQIPVHLEPIW